MNKSSFSLCGCPPVNHGSKGGFTLVEILMAMTIFIIVIAALFSTVFAALKIYYINNDYIEIAGESRRLIDDLTETGTFADDLVIYNDYNDKTVVDRSKRGDFLMFINRTPEGDAGEIETFTCYYLARTNPNSDALKSNPLSVWRLAGTCPKKGTPPKLDLSIATADPKKALGSYTKTTAKRVSGTVLNGILPRTSAEGRPGVFTNDGAIKVEDSPTVLVSLPASTVARAPNLRAGSNVTLSISPRR